MAHEFESGFVVREAAWHGLAKVLPECPTSEDAIVAADLNWIVEKKPIFDVNNKPIPNYFANTRDSDGAVLGIVTNRYEIIQNKEAFEFTDSLVSEGLTYASAGSLRNGKVIWLLANLPERSILGDAVVPYIAFTNSFDGMGSVQALMTPTRICCMNTLNLAINNAKRKWSIRHLGNIQSKVREAQETLGLANTYIDELTIESEKLANQKISDAEVENMLDMMYPINEDSSNRQKNSVQKLKDNFFYCLGQEDIKKFKGTKYAVIMAATDFADHSEPVRKTANFEANRWSTVMQGHPFVDAVYKNLIAA